MTDHPLLRRFSTPSRRRASERYLTVLGLIMALAFAMAMPPAMAGEARIEGVVMDREGRPMPGAHWWLRIEAGIAWAKMGGNRLAEGEVDERGRFEAAVPAGAKAWVVAEHEGWRGESESFVLSEGRPERLEIRLDRPLIALRLALLDTEDKPVAGAMVGFRRPDMPPLGESTRGYRWPYRSLAEGELIARLEPGKWQIVVSHRMYETLETELELSLARARPPSAESLGVVGESERMTLRLEAPSGARHVLKIRALDPEGRPIPETRIIALSWDGDTKVVPNAKRTDAEGRWTTEVIGDGAIRLHVEHPEWEGMLQQVQAPDLAEEIEVVLRRGGTLWGEIHGLEARDLRHFRIDILPADPAVRPFAEFEQGPPGVYRIYKVQGVPLEGARLFGRRHNQALPRDFGLLSFDHHGEVQRRDLRFASGFDQEIHVTVDGEVAANLKWMIDCPGRGVTGGLVHPLEGELTIYDMDPGRCMLTIDGGYPGEHDAIAHRQALWAREGQGPIELELRSARLEGRLVDRRGAPLADIELRLEMPGEADKDFERTTSNGEGRFDFGRVIRGRWSITANDRSSGDLLARWPVDVSDDTQLELSVPRR